MNCVGLFFLFVGSALAAKAPIKVTIHFFEALAPKDTTSSERFQKEYEGAISTAKTITADQLKQCGYELETKTVFYNASDSIEALEHAKLSSFQDVWLMIGPRRSNHYVLLAKGAPNTPTVSTMASAKELDDLGNLHISMAPKNRAMAKAAAIESKKRAGKQTSYVSVVNDDCVACIDFSEQFDIEGKKIGLKKLKEFKITGETPDLVKITEEISKLKPAFVLLPNYSKVAAQSIAAFHKVAPSAFYVGGDGWGDSRFGFLQNANDLEGSMGFTVRGFPAIENGLKEFKLGKNIAASKTAHKPGSASALALLKILDSTVEFLCKYKPKNKDSFKTVFLKNGQSLFKSPWGVNIYNFKSGDISFARSVK